MAKLFQVNLPDGMSSLKLDSQGRATVQYTVKNVSARAIDGRAILISIPQSKPPSGPVEKGWVKLDGNSDRHFDVDKEETFVVKIAVPPKSPVGDYTFRMDTVWVDQTDQGDAGGAVRFTVKETVKPPISPWVWLIPVILIVLIGAGIGLYVALRPKMVTVPRVTGESFGQAVIDIEGAGLRIAPTLVGDTTKSVATQDPGNGASVKANSEVTLTFPANPPTACGGRPCVVVGVNATHLIDEAKARMLATPAH
jgi:PASTA domain